MNQVQPGQTESFSCAPVLKEIGRGKEGMRSLSRIQAQELMAAILSGQVSDLELGAVLIALRVKGESADELLGFLDAIDTLQTAPSATLQSLWAELNAQSAASGKPVVVIPSYNGARRKPNFTPLLAGLLTQAGYPVLVHGYQANALGRVSSHEIMSRVQWKSDLAPRYLSLDDWQPVLADLMRKREVLGVRNFSHTLVKLLVPYALNNSVLVCSYTHPEFWHLQREILCQRHAAALVLRGHEGEPVAAPYRVPRMDGVKNGEHWCITEGETLFSEQPDPRPDISAQATALQTAQWLKDPSTMPHGFNAQLQAIEALTTQSFS